MYGVKNFIGLNLSRHLEIFSQHGDSGRMTKKLTPWRGVCSIFEKKTLFLYHFVRYASEINKKLHIPLQGVNFPIPCPESRCYWNISWCRKKFTPSKNLLYLVKILCQGKFLTTSWNIFTTSWLWTGDKEIHTVEGCV